MKLYIIRHGDPDYAHDCLTPLGKRQAEALARRFASHRLDRIYSSPMGRAKETAKPTCEILHKDFTVLDWCSENAAYEDMSVATENGRRWCFHQQSTNYKNNDTIALYHDWQKANPEFDCDGVTKRIQLIADGSDRLLAELGYERDGCIYKIVRPNDESVGVFCHQGFGITWLAHLTQIPPHIFWATFDMSHTGVTVLEWKNQPNGITTPQVLQFDDLSHIFAARLPMRFENNRDI